MPWDHGKYREGTAYRKNVNHTKKERSPKDLDREAWREIEKTGTSQHTWRRGYKKWTVLNDHRRHRRYSKRMVKRGEWEELFDRDWFVFNNPWHWD